MERGFAEYDFLPPSHVEKPVTKKGKIINWKETVMSPERITGWLDSNPVRNLIETQAEITWKPAYQAGYDDGYIMGSQARDAEIEQARQEGYERGAKEHGAISHLDIHNSSKQEGIKEVVNFTVKYGVGKVFWKSPEGKFQLKRWFKDNPELLKEWGI